MGTMLRGGNRAGKGTTPNTRSREQPTPEELPNKTARVAVAQTASNTTRNHPANTPTFPVSNVATSSSSSNKRTVSRMDNHMNPQINYINQMHPHMQQLQQLPIFHPLPPGTLTPPLRPEALAHMQAASSSTLNSAAGSEGESSEEERPSKSTGRRKIKIEYIQDRTKRNITFSKRKAGIMKKVMICYLFM